VTIANKTEDGVQCVQAAVLDTGLGGGFVLQCTCRAAGLAPPPHCHHAVERLGQSSSGILLPALSLKFGGTAASASDRGAWKQHQHLRLSTVTSFHLM